MMFRARAIGFDSDRNAVTIITNDEVVEVPETTKWEVAQRVLDQVVRHAGAAQIGGESLSLVLVTALSMFQSFLPFFISFGVRICITIQVNYNRRANAPVLSIRIKARSRRARALLPRDGHLRFLPARER